MALMKYFKKIRKPDGSNPNITSSNERDEEEEIISISLEAANPNKKRKRTENHHYTEYQRDEMGRYALENSNKSCQEKFSVKYGHRIPESTVRNFKRQYQATLKSEVLLSSSESESPSYSKVRSVDKVLSKKKRGRKSLLGERLDAMIHSYVHKLSLSGAAVNSSLVLAAAEGLVKRHKPSVLAQHGGPVVLKKSWALHQLKRMGYTKRRGTKTARKIPMNFGVIKSGFLNRISNVVHLNKIPSSMIINWDQTGVHLVPSSQWTMASRGSKQVKMVALDDKREITCLLASTAAGTLLPPQVVLYLN